MVLNNTDRYYWYNDTKANMTQVNATANQTSNETANATANATANSTTAAPAPATAPRTNAVPTKKETSVSADVPSKKLPGPNEPAFPANDQVHQPKDALDGGKTYTVSGMNAQKDAGTEQVYRPAL